MWRTGAPESRTAPRPPTATGGSHREPETYASPLFVCRSRPVRRILDRLRPRRPVCWYRLGHVHRVGAVTARERDLRMCAVSVRRPEAGAARDGDQGDPLVP